jgi:hypothetical protein
LKTIGL